MIVNAYSTFADADPPDFAADVQSRDRSDPELDPHLTGFMGYVDAHSGAFDARIFAIYEHIGLVQRQFSFVIDEGDEGALAAWAERQNAILFMQDGTVQDAALRVLVEPGKGAPDPDSAPPRPPDSVARKARTDALLAARGIEINAHLPPVVGERELRLPEASKVARRCLALLVVAMRGESTLANDPLSLREIRETYPIGLAALSTKEQALMKEPGLLGRLGLGKPDRQPLIDASWRMESLATLLWALGELESLPFPESPCDQPAVARLAMARNSEAWIEAARLRPGVELLDALDMTYRLHWAIREAGQGRCPAPADVDAGVVRERHYALNWLLRCAGEAWDDVGTPT